MSRRLAAAAVLLWIALASALPVLTAPSPLPCCRNEAACPMHQHAPARGTAFAACACSDTDGTF